MFDSSPQLCVDCENGWLSSSKNRREIFVDVAAHESWYRCVVCGAYWLETERYAKVVPDSEVPEKVLKKTE